MPPRQRQASSPQGRGEPASELGRRVPDLGGARGPSVGGTPVIPVVMIGVGMYLAWFGVHYWRSDTKYPTDPLKAILQGKGLPTVTVTPTPEEAAVLKDVQATGTGQAAGTTTAAGRGSGTAGGTVAQSGGSSAANINLGKLLAGAYGWGPGTKDWPYLESGWQEESGWSTTAANDPSDPYNHAYGIPQANPGTKMASFGADWKTNPQTQIRWGLAYIKATYVKPSLVPGWTPNGPAAGYVGY